MKKECRRCKGYLQFEEDHWGGHQVCINCGWEHMVYRVSLDREDAIIRHQLHTGQREGLAVGAGSIRNSGVPADLIQRLQGGSTEADLIADVSLGKARN